MAHTSTNSTLPQVGSDLPMPLPDLAHSSFPKLTTVLPQWVDDILAYCRTGKYFTSISMTNSFFQTCLHLDDVKLTTANTLWRLYEWAVMPIGIRNAPSIHQRHHSNSSTAPMDWAHMSCVPQQHHYLVKYSQRPHC